MAALLLVACGGGGPAPQVRTEPPTLSGTATYDETVSANEVGVKGTIGIPRTASNSTGTNQFRVSLEALSGPYMLRFIGIDNRGAQVFLYGLATKAGVSNVTPLTMLLAAQLLGQDPAEAFAAFGASGGPRTELVTDENISDAQEIVVAYLQDVLGITVTSGTSSFVTTPFSATPGDAMFDTIKALDDRLAADGVSVATLARQIASVAALCIREKIVVNIGGQSRDFCPASKSATPEEAAPSIIDYVFQDLLDSTLTVKVTGDEVLSGRYVTASGSSFACEGTACGGIALGSANEDRTRTLSFANSDLAGATGPAVLNGALLGAIPGIALPILPCDNNRYHVILEDRIVIGDCVDAVDPLNFGGTLALIFGAEPPRGRYRFINSGSTHPNRPSVEMVTDANTSVLSVYFSTIDPNTSEPDLRYVCQGAGCNGIVLGLLTESDVQGPGLPVFVRDITFDNTVLREITADGAATGMVATLEAAFTTVYFADPSSNMRFPSLSSCQPGTDAVSIAPDIAGAFNFCSDPIERRAFDLGDDTLQLLATNDLQEPITIDLHAGAIVRVSYRNFQVNQRYICSIDCAGVIVSPPAADGTRTVQLDGTVLHEEQTFPLPGPRTLTLNSGDLVFPAP